MIEEAKAQSRHGGKILSYSPREIISQAAISTTNSNIVNQINSLSKKQRFQQYSTPKQSNNSLGNNSVVGNQT